MRHDLRSEDRSSPATNTIGIIIVGEMRATYKSLKDHDNVNVEKF